MSSRVKKQNTQPPKSGGTVTRHQWSGPLPPPAALASFDSIIPNGADRILRMSEQEQAHRISIEQAALQSNIASAKESQSQAKRGQYVGAAAVYLAIIAAVITVFAGAHPFVSIALVSVPILGMVKALVGNVSKPENK